MTETLSTPRTSQMPWEPDTSLLDAAREIAPIIRAHSEEAERERRLSQPVLKALRETGLLRMTTPRSLGGLESDPVTRALVGEEIGRHDSAAAWTLENPLDWAFFCCRLPDEGAEEIYSRGADILIAAQFGRPLKATSVTGGYRISGRAPFVSNCYDADWISSTVLVDEDGSGRGRARDAHGLLSERGLRNHRYVGRDGDAGHGQQRHLRDGRVRAPVQDLSHGAGVRAGIALSRPAVSAPGRGRRRRPVSRRRCWEWRDGLSTR